jgi:hypothetical protein
MIGAGGWCRGLVLHGWCSKFAKTVVIVLGNGSQLWSDNSDSNRKGLHLTIQLFAVTLQNGKENS